MNGTMADKDYALDFASPQPPSPLQSPPGLTESGLQ